MTTALCTQCLLTWTPGHFCTADTPGALATVTPSNLEMIVRSMLRREVIKLRAEARQAVRR
jgi:hypothetical protein